MQLVDTHPRRRRALAASIAVLAGLTGRPVRAAETCEAPHLSAQQDRALGHLLRAKVALLQCSAGSCPELIQADCGRWLDEVTAELPTVVLAARASDGRELHDVRVRVDDQAGPVAVDGKSIALDPGPHTFVFQAAGLDPVSVHIVASAGKRNETVAATFPVPALEADVPDASTTAIWGLLGVGAVTLGGFAGLAIAGEVEFRDLEGDCAPRCDVDTVDRVRGELIAADVLLATSAAVFASALVVYLATPSGAGIAATAAVGIVPMPLGLGASLRVGY